MKSVTDFIESGILEAYALGAASAEEVAAVEDMLTRHAEVRQELEAISHTLQGFSEAQGQTPSPKVKPVLMATLDYITRMQNGEELANPPELTPNSTAADFAEWLNRPDMANPEHVTDIAVKIIGYNLRATTAIVWIKEMNYQEVHDNEHERFLILEGTCDLHVGDTVHQLKPGDFFEVPLYASHTFKITSEEPCKAILQRLAA